MVGGGRWKYNAWEMLSMRWKSESLCEKKKGPIFGFDERRERIKSLTRWCYEWVWRVFIKKFEWEVQADSAGVGIKL